eukprot:353295-Chlamydomonas_euryale.AAC.6
MCVWGVGGSVAWGGVCGDLGADRSLGCGGSVKHGEECVVIWERIGLLARVRWWRGTKGEGSGKGGRREDSMCTAPSVGGQRVHRSWCGRV